MPPDTPAWNDADLAGNPHETADKARRVEQMFAAIADSYDLNNRVHTFGRDQAWRRATVKLAEPKPGDRVLDVACGTGDLSLAFAQSPAKEVIGLDFTLPMLELAKAKNQTQPDGATVPVYIAGDAMQLPLADASADIISIAFGIRNVTSPPVALGEFYRVLKPGGRLVVLECSIPTNRLLRWGFMFYFNQILPRTASLIARDGSGAYRYLPRSVSTFFSREEFTTMMMDAGFNDVMVKPLTFGAAACYRGVK